MMREQDHNRKSELLLQAIGELPDEMIAQAAPQNLPLTKHRGAKLLRPQMFPAAAMVGIGIGLCLLAHHYTSQNNGDPNTTNSSEYAYTNTSPNPDNNNASGADTNEMEDNSNSIANLASSLGLQVIAYAKENEGSKEYGCYSSPTYTKMKYKNKKRIKYNIGYGSDNNRNHTCCCISLCVNKRIHSSCDH